MVDKEPKVRPRSEGLADLSSTTRRCHNNNMISIRMDTTAAMMDMEMATTKDMEDNMTTRIMQQGLRTGIIHLHKTITNQA